MWFPPVGAAFAWGGKPKLKRERLTTQTTEKSTSNPMARACLRRLPISMVKNSTVSLGSGISCLLVGLGPLSLASGPQLVTAATPSPPPPPAQSEGDRNAETDSKNCGS